MLMLDQPRIVMRGNRTGKPKRCCRSHIRVYILDRIDGYMLMMSYISPFATACCTVATPSLRLAFSV
jgi:hypothetical protein